MDGCHKVTASVSRCLTMIVIYTEKTDEEGEKSGNNFYWFYAIVLSGKECLNTPQSQSS